MEVTGEKQREAWAARVLPPVEEVRTDLWSVPVPLPHNPLRYTLCYLFAGPGGLVVVDPGWDTDEGWEALTAGLAAAGAGPADVTGIVLTHVHPDHHGATGRLKAASDAWVAMHPAERDTLPGRLYGRPEFVAVDETHLRDAGLPEAELARLVARPELMGPVLAMVEPDRLLHDGDRIPDLSRDVRAVWTPGHTPGHLCLHDAGSGALLTGDHVLPRISPHIGHHPVDPATLTTEFDDPLGAYLASLRRIAELDAGPDRPDRPDGSAGSDALEVLPAHEYRFRGLAERTAALTAHHHERCDEIRAVLADAGGGLTSWQLTEQLSWSRGWANVTGLMRRVALAETDAHLRYLRDRGDVLAKGAAPVQWYLP